MNQQLQRSVNALLTWCIGVSAVVQLTTLAGSLGSNGVGRKGL
jgi:hypothetical protein